MLSQHRTQAATALNNNAMQHKCCKPAHLSLSADSFAAGPKRVHHVHTTSAANNKQCTATHLLCSCCVQILRCVTLLLALQTAVHLHYSCPKQPAHLRCQREHKRMPHETLHCSAPVTLSSADSFAARPKRFHCFRSAVTCSNKWQAFRTGDIQQVQ
jgi:hypothetical protein